MLVGYCRNRFKIKQKEQLKKFPAHNSLDLNHGNSNNIIKVPAGNLKAFEF